MNEIHFKLKFKYQLMNKCYRFFYKTNDLFIKLWDLKLKFSDVTNIKTIRMVFNISTNKSNSLNIISTIKSLGRDVDNAAKMQFAQRWWLYVYSEIHPWIRLMSPLKFHNRLYSGLSISAASLQRSPHRNLLMRSLTPFSSSILSLN